MAAPTGATALQADFGALVDPARRANIVVVNRSGRACKATLEGGDANASGSWTFEPPEGEEGRRLGVVGPYTLKAVTVERGGTKARRGTVAVLQPGTTHEIRIGADDSVEVAKVDD